MDPAQEKRLGKYLLKSRLGQGGMGVVYLATDTRLKRDVALKILPKSMSKDAVAVKRFLLEARVAARLSHPNVVTIHDVDQQQGQCFLVMELLTGGTAHDLIGRGPIAWTEATRIIADTCRGLAAIHDAGMIHRDIKPSNIMLAADGTVKLADFGLAKITDTIANANALTVSNAILGTPQFMSPEQCQGEELDVRSDLYSLGATYFFLLTGTAPFSDPQPLQVMFAHCSKPVPDPRALRENIPPECVEVVMKSLAKRRVDRFASANAMLSSLRDLLTPKPTPPLEARNATRTPSLPTIVETPLAISAPAGAGEATFAFFDSPPGVEATRRMPPLSSPAERKRQTVYKLAAGLTLLFLLGAGWIVFGRPPRTAESGSPLKGGSSNSIDSTSEKRDSNLARTSKSTRQIGKRAASGQGAGQGAGNQQTGLKTLEFVTDFPGIATQVSGVAFAADGKTIYSGSLDGRVIQWDISKRSIQRTLKGPQAGIRAIAAHGLWVVAGGDAKTLWVWKGNSDEPFMTLPGFLGEISALAFSPDGKKLAIGTYSEARLYKMDDSGPQLIKVLGTSTSGVVKCYMVKSIAFSSDSELIGATSWESKSVAVWDSTEGHLVDAIRDQVSDPVGIAFVPGEDRLVFGGLNDGMFQWDLAASTVKRVAHTEKLNVRSMAVFSEGRTLVSIGEWDGPIRLYDLEHSDPPRLFKKSTGTGALGGCISPDGKRLVTCGGEEEHARGFIHLWNVVPDSSP